jgi:hypothetical protein
LPTVDPEFHAPPTTTGEPANVDPVSCDPDTAWTAGKLSTPTVPETPTTSGQFWMNAPTLPETACTAGKLLTETCEPNVTDPETPTVPALKTDSGNDALTPIVAGQFWTKAPTLPLMACVAGKLSTLTCGRELIETVPEIPGVPMIWMLAVTFVPHVPTVTDPLTFCVAGKLLIDSCGSAEKVTGSELVTLTNRGWYGAFPTARPAVPVVAVFAVMTGVGLRPTDPVMNRGA